MTKEITEDQMVTIMKALVVSAGYDASEFKALSPSRRNLFVQNAIQLAINLDFHVTADYTYLASRRIAD